MKKVKKETPMSNKQRIVCAALQTQDGDIICGARHFDSIMRRRTCLNRSKWLGAEQGFIDQKGNFLTRKEAYRVAVKAKQIIRGTANFNKELYSESLY